MAITLQQAVDRLQQEFGRLNIELTKNESALEALNEQPDANEEEVAKFTKRIESFGRRATQLRAGIIQVEESTSWVRGKEGKQGN